MPLYTQQLQIAINDFSHQPAREAKIRGIRRELNSRSDVKYVGVYLPTSAEILVVVRSGGRFRMPLQDWQRSAIGHGRFRAKQMITRALPFVVAYDPTTDPDWPI